MTGCVFHVGNESEAHQSHRWVRFSSGKFLKGLCTPHNPYDWRQSHKDKNKRCYVIQELNTAILTPGCDCEVPIVFWEGSQGVPGPSCPDGVDPPWTCSPKASMYFPEFPEDVTPRLLPIVREFTPKVLCTLRTCPKSLRLLTTHTQGSDVVKVFVIQNEQITGQWYVHLVNVGNANLKTWQEAWPIVCQVSCELRRPVGDICLFH